MNKLTKLANCDHKCYPLTTFEQIVNFRLPPTEQPLVDEFCIAVRPRHTLPGPRVIVCHDYKGGYLSDACMKGSSSSDDFRFLSWHLVDTFVYFSHQLLTIPPIPWIFSAHRNGVEILGTIITENESGHSFLANVLADDEKVQQFCRSAARIMSAYKFDGWLLNVENSVEPALMLKLVDLVKLLNEECKRVNDSAKLIWYDAVIYPDGQLAWQDELNERNRIFFDHCDGIFLNYCWKTRHLINSLNMAGVRKEDVYVGIDVFGRGCYGNGGFKTHLAVDFVRKFQLSIALFAPGWIHEVFQRHSTAEFHENNAKFWSSLRLSVRHLPSELPIESFFCQGFGRQYFELGECVQQSNWTNQLAQEPQTNCDTQRIDCSDALVGGSCLLLTDLREPILRLKCKWTLDLFVLIVLKHKSTDEAFRLHRNLMVLGHGPDSLAFGYGRQLSEFNRDERPKFYDQAKLFQQTVKNGWQVYLTCLKPPENRRCSDCKPRECPGTTRCAKNRPDDYLEKLYLHTDLALAEDSIELKIGYLGIF